MESKKTQHHQKKERLEEQVSVAKKLLRRPSTGFRFDLKSLFGFGFLFMSLLVVSGVLVSLEGTTDYRSKAFELTGNAQIQMLPSDVSVGFKENQTVSLMMTTAGESVIGFQVKIDFSGTIPGDVSFTPTPVEGLDLVVHRFEGSSLMLAWLVPPSTQDFVLTDYTQFGTISFTGPKKGQLNLDFDTSITNIMSRTSYENIAGVPGTSTYQFGVTSTTDPGTGGSTGGGGKGGGKGRK